MLTDSLGADEAPPPPPPDGRRRDLPRDLHLAAELGKTLLDRNLELETSLQHMHATNQEQLQEIEYLTKQVELLRQMNDEHAKVYEQLDVTARDLEDANQKLVVDSRTSQQKILSLSETIKNLQTHVDDLQRQVEELKNAEQDHMNHKRPEQLFSVHSFSCLKELYDIRKYFVYDRIFAEKITSVDKQRGPIEEENQTLMKAVTLLQAQLAMEREKRVAVEEESLLVLRENGELEQRLADVHLYHCRAEELEAEVAETRQSFHCGNPFVSGVEAHGPGSFLISFKGSPEKQMSQSLLDMVSLTGLETEERALKRSSSETSLGSTVSRDLLKCHEETCLRRAEVVKQRGISLLNEVDAQYNALKVKYEELLKKCQVDEESVKHKAVQTSKQYSKELSVGSGPLETRSREVEGASAGLASLAISSSPEYRVLFKEIFSCIKKTKQEIHEHRAKYRSLSSQP